MRNPRCRGQTAGQTGGQTGGVRGRGAFLALAILSAALGASPAHAQEYTCGLVPPALPEMQTITPREMALAIQAVPAEGAFDIVIVPGPGLQANPAALAAFERAAARWEAVIRDP